MRSIFTFKFTFAAGSRNELRSMSTLDPLKMVFDLVFFARPALVPDVDVINCDAKVGFFPCLSYSENPSCFPYN